MSLNARSPAKLNLFLHITGRRPDGYHNLQTLFQFIDLCDEMTFDALESPTITVEPAIEGIAPEQNLIYRAATLLQQYSQSHQGAHITINKQIPMGGGMGGGSSNAATTLVALNKLWQTNLSQQTLAELGLRIGADVPIFVHGHAALAQGVGEQFEDVQIAEPWYLIAAPRCHANTAELFQEKQLTRDSKVIRIRDFLNGGGRNDFEPVLRKRFPIVDRCLTLMGTEGSAKVTGSGACLFIDCDSEQDAIQKRQRLTQRLTEFELSNQDVSWKIAKGCNRSPLYTDTLANQS